MTANEELLIAYRRGYDDGFYRGQGMMAQQVERIMDENEHDKYKAYIELSAMLKDFWEERES